MKPVRWEIEKVCDPFCVDQRCRNPYLRQVKDGWVLEASDRFVAVRVPVELSRPKERLTEGAIPAAALQEARREGKHLTVQKTQVKVGDKTYERPKTQPLPDLGYGTGIRHAVAFSASCLYAVAQALGADTVAVAYSDSSRIVNVIPIPERNAAVDGSIGLLLRLDKQEFTAALAAVKAKARKERGDNGD